MLWKCSNCGFLHEGNEAPDKCRKCGVSKDKFYSLTKEDAKKVYDLDRTNDIHMEIVKLAMQINDLAKEGIEINLDPSCAAVFKQVHEEAWTIKLRSKNEIAAHVNGSKW